MIKKLLIILPVFLVLEFLVYIVQAKQIRELDQRAVLLGVAERKLAFPAHNFGEIMADVKITIPQVLGESVEPTPVPNTVRIPKKRSYVVAAIGDSMIDTMGDSLDYLKAELKKKYPQTEFAMYNYGIGGEKVTGGLERFDKAFNRGTRNYPPLPDLKPDILIVGSYAYNPFDNYDRNGHWLALADLVTRARRITPNTYLLAEIAPLENGFGNGPGGVNWPDNIVREHTPKIIEQMENAIGIAATLRIPLIDVYDKTRAGDSKYGQVKYVNPHDNIHPSVYGQVFTAQQAVEVIHLD